MKFTLDSLIEIYMNGSFTDEAQAEFDKLMRKDPVFAERVTQAMAERVGAVPDSLANVSLNLDSKIDGLWQVNKPSTFQRVFKKSAQVALVLAATGGLYGGYKHFWTDQSLAKGEMEAISPVSDASGTYKKQGVTGDSLRDRRTSSTNSNSGKKSIEGIAGKNKNGSQANDSSMSGLPSASGSNLSTPAPLQTPGKQPAQAHPALMANKGEGELGSAGLSTVKRQPSISSVTSTEEGDALRVSIETEKRQKVVVTVVDSNGLLVRHLYQGQWNAGVHLVDWDGKDEIGNPVLPGNYTVVVNADRKTLSGTVVIQPNK